MTPSLDPLFDALSDLRPLAPRTSHERRVRRRCHELLAEERARRASPHRVSWPDLLGAAAVAAYVVAMVTAAARLLTS
jgi:hypothetical protein